MTDRARRSWIPGLLTLIGGGAIVAGCLLTWLHVGGGVSVKGVSITGTPKGNELLTGKEALVDGVAVVFLGLLLVLNRGARPLSRTFLGLLVVVGGIIAVAIAAYVVSSPRDRYSDFAVQKGALAGQTDEVNHSLVNLFDVSGQKADLGVGLFVVIGGGVLSVVGGLTVVTDRRKPTSVDEVREPSGPEPEGLPEASRSRLGRHLPPNRRSPSSSRKRPGLHPRRNGRSRTFAPPGRSPFPPSGPRKRRPKADGAGDPSPLVYRPVDNR